MNHVKHLEQFHGVEQCCVDAGELLEEEESEQHKERLVSRRTPEACEPPHEARRHQGLHVLRLYHCGQLLFWQRTLKQTVQ